MVFPKAGLGESSHRPPAVPLLPLDSDFQVSSMDVAAWEKGEGKAAPGKETETAVRMGRMCTRKSLLPCGKTGTALHSPQAA